MILLKQQMLVIPINWAAVGIVSSVAFGLVVAWVDLRITQALRRYGHRLNNVDQHLVIIEERMGIDSGILPALGTAGFEESSEVLSALGQEDEAAAAGGAALEDPAPPVRPD